MFLSLLEWDKCSLKAAGILACRYRLHQFIAANFSGSSGRILWDTEDYTTYVLHQKRSLYLQDFVDITTKTFTLHEKVAVGSPLYFQLTVNPAINTGNGIYVPESEEELSLWFSRKVPGVKLIDGNFPLPTLLKFRKGVHNIQLAVTTITGTLVITDPNEFSNGFVQGYGRAKGFGLGLMFIRPYH